MPRTRVTRRTNKSRSPPDDEPVLLDNEGNVNLKLHNFSKEFNKPNQMFSVPPTVTLTSCFFHCNVTVFTVSVIAQSQLCKNLFIC